jgi:hypothetical protein
MNQAHVQGYTYAVEKSFSSEKLKQMGFKFAKFSKEELRHLYDPMQKNVKPTARYPETQSKPLIFKESQQYFKYTKDNLVVYQMGIAFTREFIHFELFRDEFQKLFESGIVKKFGLNIYDNMNSAAKLSIMLLNKEEDPKVFSLEDLKSGFVIWLVTVLIAMVVFICEKIHYQVSNKTKEKR